MDDWGNPIPERTPGERVFGHPSADPAAEPTIIESDALGPSLPPAPMRPAARRNVWAVALGLVIVIALATGVGAFFLVSAGSSVTSETASYVPQNAVLFMAGRLDLPGNQRDKVAAFLTHFPGGKDSASFSSKYDKALDDLIGSMTDHKMSWTATFKDWVGDEMSVAMTSFDGLSPMAHTGAMDGRMSPSTMAGEGATVIIAIKDRTKAEAWVNSNRPASVSYTAKSYAGTTINVASASGGAAYAFADNVLILGSESSVKASLDAKTKGSLDKNARYQTAMNALKGDRIGWFYMDMKAYMSAMLDQAGSNACASPEMLTQSMASYDWTSGQIRADDSSLTIEMAMPKTKSSSAPNVANGSSTLSRYIPSGALASVEIRSVGAYIGTIVKAYSDPKLPAECRNQFSSVTSMLTQLGGYDWMGNAAAFAVYDPSQPVGGLIIEATDQAKADKAVTYWTNSLSLTGKSTTTTHGGVTITSFGALTSSPIEIARDGNLVILGVGRGAVAQVIDAGKGSSLGNLDRYKAAMSAAGSSNIVASYVDIPNFLKAVTSTMSASSLKAYDCEFKPYVQQLDAGAVTVTTGDVQTVRFVLTAHGTASTPPPCN